jgi:hypothetical protein
MSFLQNLNKVMLTEKNMFFTPKKTKVYELKTCKYN